MMRFSTWPVVKCLTDLSYRSSLGASTSGRQSVIILYHANSIAESQCFPFHYYRDSIASVFNLNVRLINIETFKAVAGKVDAQCCLVLFQTWYDVDSAEIESIVAKICLTYPNAKVGYLDSFAPLDFRLAEALNPHIDFYIKKHILTNIDDYSKCLFGDTNLMDYFGRRYDLGHELVRHHLPEGFINKVVLGPQFFTAEYLLGRIVKGIPEGVRKCDLHARLGVQGLPWYNKMRMEAEDAVHMLKGISVLTGGRVSKSRYLGEIRASKMTFSPFGYGEICWRDYEAVAYGSLLLKPDMAHIRTDPNVFVPNETYVPLKWDFSDLQEKCSYYLHRPDEILRITNNAFDVLRRYLTKGGFINQMRPIFCRVPYDHRDT